MLTFTRPPSNWISIAAMTELADALHEIAGRTSDVTVVVLTGGVDGYFIAHADLDDLASLGRGESVEGDPRAWRRALSTLESMPQPTVAAIDGQAWGGGCETALACTVRLGSERAHLGQPEVTVGLIPGAGGTQRLPRIAGPAVGAELCTIGRVLDADEALRVGLLNAVLPTDGQARHGHLTVTTPNGDTPVTGDVHPHSSGPRKDQPDGLLRDDRRGREDLAPIRLRP